MLYSQMSKEQLQAEKTALEKQYADYKAKGLKLDMSRGKPCTEQLDLSEPLLADIVTNQDCYGEGGVDLRNYGVLDGIRDTATAMQRGSIKVSRQCVRLIQEAQGYMWDAKEGEERPVKANDHAMDALRYFVRTVLSERNTALAAR